MSVSGGLGEDGPWVRCPKAARGTGVRMSDVSWGRARLDARDCAEGGLVCREGLGRRRVGLAEGRPMGGQAWPSIGRLEPAPKDSFERSRRPALGLPTRQPCSRSGMRAFAYRMVG